MTPHVLIRIVAVLIALTCAPAVWAQPLFQPTPEPLVKADNERWYVEGRPITYEGAFYYPTGPYVFFNRYEMLRAGNFMGIPLYVRASSDGLSRVYVPISGGLMHPYERPRTGELAGTTGDSAPSFPGEVATQGIVSDPLSPGVPAAPGPFTSIGTQPDEVMIGVELPSARYEPRPTSGAVTAPAAPPVPNYPLASAQRPQGLNGVFVNFEGRRWFSAGPAVDQASGQFEAWGKLDGFPVYRKPGEPTTIYVVVSSETPTLLAPYSARR